MFTFGYSFLFSYKNASEISGVKLIDIIYIFGNAYYMVIVFTFKIPSKPDSPNLLQLFNSNISSLGQDYAIYIRVLSPTYGIPPNFNCFNFYKLFNRPIDESLTFVDPVKISVLQFEQSDAAEITESFTSLVGMNDRSKYSISTLERAINSAKRSAYKFSTVAIQSSFNLHPLYSRYLVKLLVKLLQKEILILCNVEVCYNGSNE